jgi:Zn ribbon nucleic-acid-binding protein
MFKTSFKVFSKINKRQCNECGKQVRLKKLKLDFNEVKRFVKENNCELVSSEYVNSRTKMTFKCLCGNTFETNFHEFNTGNKRRCNECSGRYQGDNGRKSTEEFKKEIWSLVRNEYELLSNYINSKVHVDMKHNKCGTMYKVTPNNFLKGWRCPECARLNRIKLLTNTDVGFKKTVFDKVGTQYTVKGTYVDSQTKILIKHNKCGNEYMARPAEFYRGKRCPICSKLVAAKKITKTPEKFEVEVKELVGDEYIIIDKYIISSKKVTLRHKKCGYEWKVLPNGFLGGQRCPLCNESKGETAILNYFKSHHVNFERQYKILECANIKPLPFDFAILSDNNEVEFLIEYDGEQHYEAIEHFGGKRGFEQRKINDCIKDTYCLTNGIELIRIPYWEFSNIEDILEKRLNTR